MLPGERYRKFGIRLACDRLAYTPFREYRRIVFYNNDVTILPSTTFGATLSWSSSAGMVLSSMVYVSVIGSQDANVPITAIILMYLQKFS